MTTRDGAPAHSHGRNGFAKLTLGSIGVVYGDIGTSPLYALREALAHTAHDGLERAEVVGIVSLLIWTLTLIVTFKYVLLILRADNEGEGGILSLLALTRQKAGRGGGVLLALGVFGAALFYGDAVITPAISVLSAVEGLKLITPAFEPWLLPVTLLILIALFMAQSVGTSRVAAWFGPITLVWFVVMGVLGAMHVRDDPAILAALNPMAAVGFVASHGLGALAVMGSVFLAVTGAEALYADMGHFGRKPIQAAWLGLVFPALALNYLGQGSLVLADPSALANPFYLLAPAWALPGLVLLATAATVIASQAVITGAFSLSRQAVQLGLLPRLEIRHTSEDQAGQIYMPRVNWLLLIGVVLLVVEFRDSASLASAYGIAVTGTMVTTTLLAVVVMRRVWGWSLWLTAVVAGPLLAVELIFLGANLAKLLDGGYVPIALAVFVAVLVWTWVRGTAIVQAKADAESIPLTALISMAQSDRLAEAPGTAVFLTSNPLSAPGALLHNLKHNHVLHRLNLILRVEVVDSPMVAEAERITLEQISPRFARVTTRFGYMEELNVPKALAQIKKHGLKYEIMTTSFFLNRRSLRPDPKSGMPGWQDRLYIAMARSASDATSYYRLPRNRVIELGQQLSV